MLRKLFAPLVAFLSMVILLGMNHFAKATTNVVTTGTLLLVTTTDMPPPAIDLAVEHNFHGDVATILRGHRLGLARMSVVTTNNSGATIDGGNGIGPEPEVVRIEDSADNSLVSAQPLTSTAIAGMHLTLATASSTDVDALHPTDTGNPEPEVIRTWRI